MDVSNIRNILDDDQCIVIYLSNSTAKKGFYLDIPEDILDKEVKFLKIKNNVLHVEIDWVNFYEKNKLEELLK